MEIKGVSIQESLLIDIFLSTFSGNSSQVSDGAGAVLLMKRSTALEKNLPILGVFRCIFVALL